MTIIIIIVAAILVLTSVGFVGLKVMRRLRPKQVNRAHYVASWKKLQSQCATRKTWPLAIIDADDLLDEALKCRGFKGKTTGERLVAAQHEFSDNEAVWFGHKYRNQLEGKDVRTLKKQDVFDALSGFREALKDLGAL